MNDEYNCRQCAVNANGHTGEHVPLSHLIWMGWSIRQWTRRDAASLLRKDAHAVDGCTISLFMAGIIMSAKFAIKQTKTLNISNRINTMLKYEGMLYAKFGRKYIPTGKTGMDWDLMEHDRKGAALLLHEVKLSDSPLHQNIIGRICYFLRE